MSSVFVKRTLERTILERTVDIPDESGVIGYVDRYSACHLALSSCTNCRMQ